MKLLKNGKAKEPEASAAKTAAAVPVKRRKFRMTLERRNAVYGILFILPWLIGFLLFFLKPVIQSIQFSFNELEVTSKGFILNAKGLSNYIKAFTEDATFPQELVKSLNKMAGDVPIILIFSFFAALLLKQNFRGNTIVKTVFFLPVIMASGVFLRMQSQMGQATQDITATMSEATSTITLLQAFNLQKFLPELGMPQKYITLIVTPINRIFQTISLSGIQIFIFLAGLHSISPSLFEACIIEGASGWETFWKITFPMISPLILVNAIYTVIDSFTAYNNTTLNYIYTEAFGKFHFGYSSAMAWIYFLIIAVILGVVGFIASKLIFYQN
ncbi:MAG TPA: sugar ABC transporter permease [Clostridiales bacterium]|nr:sugar ABC transporter permease [Clostridiales bacterium]